MRVSSVTDPTLCLRSTTYCAFVAVPETVTVVDVSLPEATGVVIAGFCGRSAGGPAVMKPHMPVHLPFASSDEFGTAGFGFFGSELASCVIPSRNVTRP